MVVRSRCFAFRALITQTQIWKRFWVETSTSLLYSPISSSAETRLSWHFKREKTRILESIFFAKQGLISRTSFVYKTSQLVRICLLISALNKRALLFFSGKLFYKSNRRLFSCVCKSWYKHSRGWENSRQLWLSRILPTPLGFISGYANTENVFYCFYKITLRNKRWQAKHDSVSSW